MLPDVASSLVHGIRTKSSLSVRTTQLLSVRRVFITPDLVG